MVSQEWSEKWLELVLPEEEKSSVTITFFHIKYLRFHRLEMYGQIRALAEEAKALWLGGGVWSYACGSGLNGR